MLLTSTKSNEMATGEKQRLYSPTTGLFDRLSRTMIDILFFSHLNDGVVEHRWIVRLNEQSIQGASCLANGKMKYWNCSENEINSFVIVRVTCQRKNTYYSFRTWA